MKKKTKKKIKLILWGSVICGLILVAVFAGVLTNHDPEQANLAKKFLAPCVEMPLGADHMGRCILCRIIYGARVSLAVSGCVVLITAAIGVTTGVISGYYGGKIDSILMRIVDVFLSFPSFLFTLAFAGLFGGGTRNLIILLSFFGWMYYARVVRSQVLCIREQEFILATRGMGAGHFYIIRKHIFPNIIGQMIVIMTMDIGGIILAISGLSFLGVGVQPPLPEWGYMLNDGKLYLSTKPELMIFPGLAIMLTILAFNFFGDTLRDILDVKESQLLKEQ